MGSVIVTVVERVVWLVLAGELVTVCPALVVWVVTDDVGMVVVCSVLGELVVVCSALVVCVVIDDV